MGLHLQVCVERIEYLVEFVADFKSCCSAIKRLREHPQFVLPDRSKVTMTAPFMDAYVRLLIQTCHKRGVHAMGGMAAQIPIKNDPAANDAAMAKVRADKTREVTAGHDGVSIELDVKRSTRMQC